MKTVEEITTLMAQYFENKDKSKQLKIDRLYYVGDDSCIRSHIEDQDCIEANDGKMCPFCMQRNEYHREIVRLGYANTGIMNKIRGIINRIKHDK